MTGRDWAAALAVGMAAGLVGTAATTVSQLVEGRVRHHGLSLMPALAVEHLLGRRPTSRRAERRLALMVHLAYGTAWGAVRGPLGKLSGSPVVASAAHAAMIQAAAVVMLPAMRVAPPVNRWPLKELAIQGVHQGVYVLTTGWLAERWLRRHDGPGEGPGARSGTSAQAHSPNSAG